MMMYLLLWRLVMVLIRGVSERSVLGMATVRIWKRSHVVDVGSVSKDVARHDRV